MDNPTASTDGVVKRVLLTGAAGFLGSHCLTHLLANTDWEVVCPVSFRHKGLPERLATAVARDEWWGRVTVVKCDISCPINDTTRTVFGDVEYILNYASESHVDRSITDPVPFVKNNIDIILSILEYARAAKPAMLLHISTDEVYGPALGDHVHCEWSPIVPSSPYSASKAAQEALATSYWRTYDVPVVFINCMNPIGEMQDPEKFVPMTIGKVLRGEEVAIHASPDGHIGSRFYLHARNLADAALFLICRGQITVCDNGANRPDRWNVVGERELNNLEMAQLVAKLVDKDLRYRLVDFHSARPGYDIRYGLDGSKIAEAGWTTPVGLEDSLRRLVEWTVSRPLWLGRLG